MKKENLKFLTQKIDGFGFKKGKIINNQYKVIEMLGSGFEGEVYLVREVSSGIERAIKFFKPHQNPKNKTAKLYAKKLHKLRHCQIIMQYISLGKFTYWGREVHFIVSELLPGETLAAFLKNQRGQRLQPLQAVLLLHSLVSGLEEIHASKEYHGDLHLDNIIVQKFGLGFDLKALDMFHYGKSTSQDFKDDLHDAIRVFYDALGGQKHYKKHPSQIKYICAGLKKNIISKRFKNMSFLKYHLENLRWGQ